MSESNRLSDVDHLRLRLALEQIASAELRAALACRDVSDASARLGQLRGELSSSYDLRKEDECNYGTGIITRAPRADPPVKLVPDPAPAAAQG